MARRKVSTVINIYSKKVKDQIVELCRNFFGKEDLEFLVGDVFQCVDELIKNSIKANYKFILVLNKLYDKHLLDQPDADEDTLNSQINTLIKDKSSFDIIAPEIYREHNLVEQVRRILNEEATQIKLKDKAYISKRECNEAEIEQLRSLKRLAQAKTLLKKNSVQTLLKIESDGEFIFIEVTNTAPITDIDLRRIHEKRDEFFQYHKIGRDYEFFVNHLDTTDSGFGLGYATIDSMLIGIGLDPYQTIQILAASDTTVILSFPIAELKKANKS
ncbi:MAG: hypothetical protein PF637_02405 [Spirochaetes bacterium]|jgi:hypothetical protein|nr:hypothetical protein [Spirochaetota bacterium]